MPIDVERMLSEAYAEDTESFFEDANQGRLFDAPFVGVADARDPWFERFQELIGEFHWTPQEALARADPGAEARSVISWCLPVSRVAREDNAQETVVPARTWAYVRTFGEHFVTRLRHGMEKRLRDLGFAAIAPAVVPDNKVERRPGIGLSSQWSERHVAMVAGLGTFGLSGGLITMRGIAHRLGSVVTDAEIPSTPRPYGDDAFAWCLTLAGDECGACIDRCPTDSIGLTTEARDKDACRKHSVDVIVPHAQDHFGWEGIYGCGLCQTAVPCEYRNPTVG